MKNDVMPSIIQMDAKELKNLVKEVRETIATDFTSLPEKQSTFGIADLWNIRRNSKSYNDLLNR